MTSLMKLHRSGAVLPLLRATGRYPTPAFATSRSRRPISTSQVALSQDKHGHPSNDKDAPRLTPLYTPLMGKHLTEEPILNKGSAFTAEERELFHLKHYLPYEHHALNVQVQRAAAQLFERQEPVLQYAFLRSLRDQNQVLFYALLQAKLKETLSIIYTPTVAEAIKQYSHMFRRPDGLFLSYPHFKEGGVAYLEDALTDYKRLTSDAIDLVVVTDGEGILGIGDWGAGGIQIAVGKQTLYTLGGGIDPNRCLNVVLDAGTNNEKLLNDELYLGWRKKRMTGWF